MRLRPDVPLHALALYVVCLLGFAACGGAAAVLEDDNRSGPDAGQPDADPRDSWRGTAGSRDAGAYDGGERAGNTELRDGAVGPMEPSEPVITGERVDDRASDAGSVADSGIAEEPDPADEPGATVDPGPVANRGIVAAGVRWLGRVDLTTPDAPRFSWPGTGFVARFRGTGLRVQLDDSAAVRFKAVVDGVPQASFLASTGEQVLASGLALGEHTVALYRQYEAFFGDSRLSSVRVDDGALLPPPPAQARLIELIGDSVSTGGGALGKPSDADCNPSQSHWDSYGAVAARALDAELSTVAASGHGVYRDYSGNTAGLLLPRLYEHALAYSAMPLWSFGPQPQVVVINLGTNDAGIASTDPGPPFRDAYRRLVQTVRAKYPAAHIVGVIGPMLNGAVLAAMRGHIAAVMDGLRAAGDERVSAFLGFEPQTDDKLGCGNHPNVAEHALMGAQLAAELRRLLGW